MALDLTLHPSCLHVQMKASETDPFRQGCFIHIGQAQPPMCAVQAVLAYLVWRGNTPGSFFSLVASDIGGSGDSVEFL